MIYPLIIPLIFITLSSWRALVKAHAQRDLFDACAGRVIAIEGLVVEKKDSSLRILTTKLAPNDCEIAVDGIVAHIRSKNTGIRPGDSVAGSIIFSTYHPHNGLLYGQEVGTGLSCQERPPPTSVSGIVARCATMRAKTISGFKNILSPNAYELVSSLLLGRSYEERTARNHAREWGILHLLARSGLHLALIFWILRKSLALMPFKPGVVSALEWGIILAYSLISFASFSYLRALSMAAVGGLCALSYRRIPAVIIWWYGCSIVAFVYPWAIFAIDFQLSALATCAILLEARAARS